MLAANPGWLEHAGEVLPDGDVRLEPELTSRFIVPECRRCSGVLKPDVVFFGESVPSPRVEAAYAMLEEAQALLVVGSSLAVYSGYRFVDRAVREEKPVVILNDGETRGDAVASAKVERRLGEALPELVDLLGR
jgi:NAD-dependent SIR2 family protein deacetylase